MFVNFLGHDMYRQKAALFFFLMIVLFSFGHCKSDSNNKIKSQVNEVVNNDNNNSDKSTDSNALSLNSRNPAAVDANSDINNKRRTVITDVVQMANPAIVGINVTEIRRQAYVDPFDWFYDDPVFRQYFGSPNRSKRYREYQVQSLGSGFIISPDGYVLTNHHVAGNASKVIVTMTGGKKFEAKIIGADKATDVALLKIDGKNLPYLKFSQDNKILVGEWVIAFGNPFGLFDLNAKPTVTVGVVSNTGLDFFHEGRVYKGMIQTDAAISSGNSGGPLLDALGQVIGMNTIIFSTAQNRQGAGSIGIGWAIPIQRVKNVVEILKKNGKVNRDFEVGLQVKEIDQQIADYLGIDVQEGVVVMAVQRNSDVAKSGIEPGDIITEVNGRKINKEDDFYIQVFDSKVGDTLHMKLKRGKDILNVDLKLNQKKV